jgi:hypothetical protein
MVADSLLVLTTGRLFCSRYVDALPVRIVRCPVTFPPLTYYQLWHDLTHGQAPAMRWLREQVRDVSRSRWPAARAHGRRDRHEPAAKAIRADLLDFTGDPGWGLPSMQQVRWRPDHWLLIGEDGRIAGAQRR